ncbi:MAG: type VI secretion system protein TssA [Treponema sp.]|jgi:type VI secretion system ImpA family protein|nr:type VI secretion system protein TssA [Treponema sp.]
MIDIEGMSLPLEGEDPAGSNLEYDPLYVELDSLATGTPDSTMGDSIVEGQDPDWKLLNKNCLELWKKTRDLRVASYLAVAQTALEGLPGLCAGIKLIHFLIRDMWEQFYPRLDPDDDNDPLERLNILAMLSPAAGAINDPIMFIARFRKIRLLPSLKYTLRDLLVSQNELPAGNENGVDPKLLHAELINVPPAEIEARVALAQEVKDEITALCKDMNEKMEAGYVLSMDTLLREVEKLRAFYRSNLEAPGSGGTEPDSTQAASDSVRQTGSGKVDLASFQANCRAEALLLLRKGSDYFQREEPNSPIPMLVNRALRFSEMSFLELLEDIAPDAISRGRDVLGVKEE